MPKAVIGESFLPGGEGLQNLPAGENVPAGQEMQLAPLQKNPEEQFVSIICQYSSFLFQVTCVWVRWKIRCEKSEKLPVGRHKHVVVISAPINFNYI